MKQFLMVLTVFLIAGALFAQQMILKEVSGMVEMKAPGSITWTAARPGMTLTGDTSISTGFKGRAVIGLGDSILVVSPLTRLTLAEIKKLQTTDQVSLHLRAGRVRAEVNPPAEGKVDFTVRSPSATASVRGTVFEFDTLTLSVEEGTVSYAGSAGKPVLVYQGESSSVGSARGAAANPTDTRAADLLPQMPIGSASGADNTGGNTVSNTVDFTVNVDF